MNRTFRGTNVMILNKETVEAALSYWLDWELQNGDVPNGRVSIVRVSPHHPNSFLTLSFEGKASLEIAAPVHEVVDLPAKKA